MHLSLYFSTEKPDQGTIHVMLQFSTQKPYPRAAHVSPLRTSEKFGIGISYQPTHSRWLEIEYQWQWWNKWDMALNTDKVHIMKCGPENAKQMVEGVGQTITMVQEEKDLGVLIPSHLRPTKMVQRQLKESQRPSDPDVQGDPLQEQKPYWPLRQHALWHNQVEANQPFRYHKLNFNFWTTIWDNLPSLDNLY